MADSAVDICNLGFGLLGGAGDQAGASGQISSLSDTDAVSVWANTMYPQARKKAIIDMAVRRSPFRCTVKHAELDVDLTDNDKVIQDITVSGTTITVETEEAHERSTGDTVVLKGIDGDDDEGIQTLNGSTYTITVIDSTSFTLDSTTGSESWDYTEDSGVVSDAPEMGPWTYAYDLPSACIAVIRVTDEIYYGTGLTRTDYQFDTILNRDGDGLIILTNNLTNSDGDGIYIEYAIDQTTTTLYPHEMDNLIAVYFASKIAPVVGRNSEERRKFLLEYEQLAIRNAAGFNNTQYNLRSKKKTDFRGGRRRTLHSI